MIVNCFRVRNVLISILKQKEKKDSVASPRGKYHRTITYLQNMWQRFKQLCQFGVTIISHTTLAAKVMMIRRDKFGCRQAAVR